MPPCAVLCRSFILATACLSVGTPHLQAQDAAPDQAELSCPVSSASDYGESSVPTISIAEVTFSGSLEMPITDQTQIADSIKQQEYGNSLDGLIDDAVDRVKAGWLDHGYFKAQVTGEKRTLTSSSANQPLALSFHVNEGLQYRLGEITFRNNKAVSDIVALRGLFPIKDGDIASRDKIAKGLENLRKAYGNRGYINFTSVPNTELDDETRLLFLDIDLDEGKQFHIGDFNIVGLDEPATQELLKDFPMKRGQVYDRRLFESFMLRHPSISAPDDPSRIYPRLDEPAGTISITVDARPCRGCIGPCSLVQNRHSPN